MQDYTQSKKPDRKIERQEIDSEELEKVLRKFFESLEKAKSTEKIDHSHSIEVIKHYLEKISTDLSNSSTSSNRSEKNYLPNNQDNELDTLVNLLKEYTQKKIQSSNAIIILSLFWLLFFTGVSLAAFLYIYQSYSYGTSFLHFDTNLIDFPFLCLASLLVFLLKKLKDAYHNKEIVDRNLAKIIRTTSQAGEHVHSGFGKKLELDVRLTEAENALENSLL